MIWIEITDLENYDAEFERIVNSIHGQYNKPPMGEKPSYVRPDVLHMDGLTRIDSVIFERACKIAVEQGHSQISGDALVSYLSKQGVSESQIIETQEVLEGRSYIEVLRVMGPPQVYDFSITWYGFDQYASTGITDYEESFTGVARLLVQGYPMNNDGIAQELKLPIRIVEHIFESLAQRGLVKYVTSHGGACGLSMDVWWISPELRRSLEDHA